MLQTTTWQRRILNLAKADNYHDLFWVVIVKYPLGEVEGKTSLERDKKRYRYPTIGGSIPVIAVGPDVDASKEMARFLTDIFHAREFYTSLHKTGLMLTTSSELNRYHWHTWGDYDAVCPNCAQIINLQKCTCNTDKGGLFATI